MLLKFFKWFYYPNEEPKKRNIPTIMENIPMLKRREQSSYKPADLWTVEDNILFLKYCLNNHAISRDTSCTPHEILKLRIKDLVFKTAGQNYQYAEFWLMVKQVVEVYRCLIPYPICGEMINTIKQTSN